MFRNSKVQGDAGLGKAISYFTGLGYSVSLPLTDSQDYDLVVEIEGVLKKVQVKTGTSYVGRNKNLPTIYTAVKGGNKSGNSRSAKVISEQDWNLLYCWHIKEDIHYLIPKEEITSEGQINLGDKVAQFRI